jgi:hypothetical protein
VRLRRRRRRRRARREARAARGQRAAAARCAAPPRDARRLSADARTLAAPAEADAALAAERLAEFVAKNGRSFEDMTRERNPGDTPFKCVRPPR